MDTQRTNSRVKPESKSNKEIVSNVASMDADNPIPTDLYSKGFISNNGARYLPFLESEDNFFQLLTEAKLLSPTTTTCINSKCDYIAGNGWYIEDLETIPQDLLDWAEIINDKGENLDDSCRDVCDHILSVGNTFVEVSRGTVGGKKFIRVFVGQYFDYRLEKDEESNELTGWVIKTKEFRKNGLWSFDEKHMVKLPLYNPGISKQKWLKDGKTERLVIHIKNKMTGVEEYGLPSNIASLPQQILEYKGARYNIDNFENNLVVGGVVTTTSTMSTPEASKHAKNIVKAHTGDGKRGRWVFMAGQDLKDLKLHPFDITKDGDYLQLDKRLEEVLLKANNWSMTLIDPEASSLGSSAKHVREVFEMKNNTVIKPLQNFIVRKFLKPILKIADDHMGTKWHDLAIKLRTIAPASHAGEIDINSIVDVDEARQMVGLPKNNIEDKRKVSEVKPKPEKSEKEGKGV